MIEKAQHINKALSHASHESSILNASQPESLKLSVVVPVHKLGVTLERCLGALCTYGLEAHEIILVLDGLKAGKEYFEQFDLPNLNIEWLEVNRGPAFARNHGAAVASGDIIFFIDSDVAINSGTICKLMAHFEQSDSSDALIGSYDDEPHEKSLVSKYRNLLHHHTHQLANGQISTFWGACGAIKKEVFSAVGGFDVSYTQPSVEDIDLGYRLTDEDYTIWLNKDFQVKHLKYWTFLKTLRTDIFDRARPWTLLLKKYDKLPLGELNTKPTERRAALLLFLGIGASILGIFSSIFWPVAALFFGLLLFTKRDTYVFFMHYFKAWQMPFVVLLHWSYLFCAVIGFVLGSIDSFGQKNSPRPEEQVFQKGEVQV